MQNKHCYFPFFIIYVFEIPYYNEHIVKPDANDVKQINEVNGMTLKTRLLTARLFESLKKHPEYVEQLQIEVIASSKHINQLKKEGLYDEGNAEVKCTGSRMI